MRPIPGHALAPAPPAARRPRYLGIDRNRFNAEVRPLLSEIPIGTQEVAFDRLYLDAWVWSSIRPATGRRAQAKGVFPWDASKRLASSIGVGSGTSTSASLALGMGRHILNVAASAWLGDHSLTWPAAPPKIKMLQVTDASHPYPLSWGEQVRPFGQLPAHLARMTLLKVITGCRDQECAHCAGTGKCRCRNSTLWSSSYRGRRSRMAIDPGERATRHRPLRRHVDGRCRPEAEFGDPTTVCTKQSLRSSS